MSVSTEHGLKCRFCGGSPVIYDSEFSEYICPHCGAVLEDRPLLDVAEEPRPSDELKHIGSYILNPRFRRMILRQVNTVYTAEHRKIRAAVNSLRDMCDVLSVPETVCLSAEWRLLNTLGESGGWLAHGPRAARRLRILSALLLYVSARELGHALSLEDIAAVLGVKPGRLYSALWQHREVLGFKHADATELYLPRVLKALSKQLTPEQLERVAKLTRELMEKYPVVSGKPLHRTLAYALVACRMLRVGVCAEELIRKLGVSDGIYSKAAKLYKTIKRLKKLEKK